MRYVTNTGRALSPGRVTRASKAVRKRARRQERPLSFNMACHPVALTKTPMHPGCYTYLTHIGEGQQLANTMQRESFLHGKGLKRKGRYRLTNGESRTYGFTDSVHYAMVWKGAAARWAVYVEVIDEE